MTGRLEGRTAVITGASKGIGKAIAHRYAEEGATVVVGARSEAVVEAVAADIREKGGTALAVPLDVTSDASVAEFARRTAEEFGHVDTVVNNAGAYVVDHFTDIAIDEFQRLIDVNYLGIVRVTQAFLPAMLDRGAGAIINVASTAGKYGSPYQVPYNASKHAAVGLTRSLGLEIASRGVRVNAIAPGFVETDLVDQAKQKFSQIYGVSRDEITDVMLQRVPMRRFLQPEEVAHLAVYLASDESAGMTGQAMTISGGLIVV